MVVFLNGRFVPEGEATVSVFDRSFLYGDGLFETVRVLHGRPFRWGIHLERLRRGVAFLKMPVEIGAKELEDAAVELIRLNHLPDSILRLTVSRGAGQRGYSPASAANPTTVMTLHPAPGVNATAPGWKVIRSSLLLPPGAPLSAFKTCSRLTQVMARAEADSRGADEALLFNADGQLTEGAASNLFWAAAGVVHTPPLAAGALPGVTRAAVEELCARLGLTIRETWADSLQPLFDAEGVFLSLSSVGIAEVVELEGKPLGRASLVTQLHREYWALVSSECGLDRLVGDR